MDCLLLSWVLCTLNLYWNFKLFSHCHLLLIIFLDRRQWGPIKLVLLVIIGWLVDNAVFSETAVRIFLIFYMKLGDYEGRKVAEPEFWKKFLIWRYSWKGLQNSPKSDTDIFLKNGCNNFFGFCPSLWIKPIFQKKLQFAIEIVKNCPNWGFWPFYSHCIIRFPWFCT